MSPWRVLAVVWGSAALCALASAGCGARTAVGISTFGGSANAGTGGGSVAAGAQSASGTSMGANASGGSDNGGGAMLYDAGPPPADAAPNDASGYVGTDGGADLGDSGPEQTGGADDAGAPGCDPNAGLSRGATGCVAVPAPRLLAPLSSSTVTSRQPTLRWALAQGSDGAHIEICSDRACQQVLLSFDVLGEHAKPNGDLPAGVLFWRAFGRSGDVIGHSPSATWQVVVGHRSALSDTSWGTTLDINGDGFADALIGAPMVGSNQPSVVAGTGRAYMFLGSKAGLVATPASILTGPDGAHGQFGSVTASAGDINGDGVPDVIIGAPGALNYAGLAYVYLGSASGLVMSSAVMLSGLGTPDAAFGTSVASAGDVNGDGYADVIVGAPLTRGDGSINQFMGRAFVFLGSASGITTTPVATLRGPEAAGAKYGQSVASAGDVNADGYADLVVSDSPYIQVSASGYQDSAAFYVYLGGPTGPATTPVLDLENQNWMFSTVASGSDLNGDGRADLVVGTAGSSSGAIYFGNASGVDATPDATLGAQLGSGGYNFNFYRGGDINGDGFQDLLASFDQIFVYSGSASGVVDAPAVLTPPVTAFGATIYGYTVTHVGDINGDGYDDVMVGARFDNNFVGRAYVYMGSTTGLVQPPALILNGTDGPGGEFD